MKRERSIKRKQILLAGIIAFLMIVSVIGFLWGDSSEDQIKYKEYYFTKKDNLWYTEVEGKQLRFHYFPSQVEEIEAEQQILNKILSTPMVYLTYDPNQSSTDYIAQAQYELDLALRDFKIYGGKALTKENTYGLPVMKCENATSTIPVLEFRKTNQTMIRMENNCIILEGDSGLSFLKVRDRMVYGFYRII